MLIVKWKTQRSNTAGVRYSSTTLFISSKWRLEMWSAWRSVTQKDSVFSWESEACIQCCHKSSTVWSEEQRLHLKSSLTRCVPKQNLYYYEVKECLLIYIVATHNRKNIILIWIKNSIFFLKSEVTNLKKWISYMKANFTLEQAMNAQRGSVGIALLFLWPRR
jgi:hypothetical protein